jgi:hypothetical protein
MTPAMPNCVCILTPSDRQHNEERTSGPSAGQTTWLVARSHLILLIACSSSLPATSGWVATCEPMVQLRGDHGDCLIQVSGLPFVHCCVVPEALNHHPDGGDGSLNIDVGAEYALSDAPL